MFSEPQIAAALVCGTIVLAITTLASLASLWAATPRASWLVRATPICLFLGLQFPIGCFDFALVFAMQAMLVVGTFAVARRIMARRKRRQVPEQLEQGGPALRQQPVQVQTFTLARMFRALLMGGLVFAMMSYAPDEWDVATWTSFYYWKDVLLAGLTLAVTTLAAWVLIAVRGRRRFLIALLGAAAAVVAARYVNYPWWFEFLLNADMAWPVAGILVVSHISVLVMVLTLLRRAGWAWWPVRPSISVAGTPLRTLWRVALGILAIVLLTPALDLYRALIPPGEPPPIETIEPNGRVELIKALGHLKWNSIANRDFAAASLSQQETFLRQNAATIAAMRTALRLPSLKSFDVRDLLFLEGHSELSEIAYLFEGGGKYADSIGDLDQAMQWYVNILQLGPVAGRGGLSTDDIRGCGIEDLGVRSLVSLLGRIDSVSLARLQDETRAVQQAVEPVENFLERERIHGQFAMGYAGRIIAWLSSWRLYGDFYMEDSLPVIRADRDASLELLITECAIERYQHDHGSPPAALADLVPEYLPAIPLDPFDGQPLRYRQTDSGHLLYSIGRNYADDGGVRSTQTRLEGDLLLRP